MMGTEQSPWELGPPKDNTGRWGPSLTSVFEARDPSASVHHVNGAQRLLASRGHIPVRESHFVGDRVVPV